MRQRYEFESDNTAAVCPEAWAALVEANRDGEASYGDDKWTNLLCDRVREIFEADCEVFLLFNGTAANALALAHLSQPFNSVVCHESAHIATDECGAPEFFSGGSKLLPTSGSNGKLDLARVKQIIKQQIGHGLHAPKPRVISVTQSTEFGTVYSRDEIEAIAKFARDNSLLFHMDGARFANAIARLNCAPKEITWMAGVDVLCFGGTKNGTAAGELVVFFKKELARDFEYRAKQAGQLASKMRFLSAPWVGLLTDGVWLKNARNANRCAALLSDQLSKLLAVSAAFPQEASAVFFRMPEPLVRQLWSQGWHFLMFVEPDIYRLVCSWAANEDAINDFVNDVKAAM